MVPERTVEPSSKLNLARRVSMTRLWVAISGNHHTEKTVETKRTHNLLLLTLKKQGKGVRGEMLNENCPAERDNLRSDFTTEALQ